MRERLGQPAALVVAGLVLCTVTYLYLGLSRFYDDNGFGDDRPSELRRLYSAEFRENAEFAIGIHLGYSYAAAVAWFRNGTTLNLARVSGSPEYRAAMEQVIQKRAAESGHGLEPALAPVLSALKNRSEAVLGAAIEVVHLATPWIREYFDVWPEDAFLASLRMVGLERGIHDQHLPTHVNEGNAVLAGNGLQLCRECSCVGGPNKNVDRFYYISLTDIALYTSIQSNICLYLAWRGNASIDTSHGLGSLLAHDTQQSWDSLEEKLFSDVAAHTKVDSDCQPMMVLVAGGEVPNPQFLAVASRVVSRVQAMCDELPPPRAYMNRHGELAARTKIEYLVSEDATFAAAKGAAFAMHTAFWGYCANVDMSKAWVDCWGEDEDDFLYPVKETTEANNTTGNM